MKTALILALGLSFCGSAFAEPILVCNHIHITQKGKLIANFPELTLDDKVDRQLDANYTQADGQSTPLKIVVNAAYDGFDSGTSMDFFLVKPDGKKLRLANMFQKQELDGYIAIDATLDLGINFSCAN